MKKILCFLASFFLGASLGTNVVSCFVWLGEESPQLEDGTDFIFNTELTINGMNLITNSDALIFQAFYELNPELKNIPLKIENQTLTSAVISSSEFKESVKVSFNALLPQNIFLGAIGNDESIILNTLNEQILNTSEYSFNVISISSSSIWNNDYNSFNIQAVIASPNLAGRVTLNFIDETFLEDHRALFPSIARSMIELQDGTILVAGGNDASNSFLLSVDLSDPADPQTELLAQGPDVFPSAPHSITQLQDGTILAAGGVGGDSSFLATVDLSNPTPQTEVLIQGYTPAIPTSMIELQDGTILVTGAGNTSGNNSFLIKVDLSGATPQVEILIEGFIPGVPRSMLELQDGTILFSGGAFMDGHDSFLATVDLSGATPQTEVLIQNQFAPSVTQSMIQLEDGTILATGGIAITNGSDTFLATIDLSGSTPQTEVLIQNGFVPSIPYSMIQLQDGTIFVIGGNGNNSFLTRV